MTEKELEAMEMGIQWATDVAKVRFHPDWEDADMSPLGFNPVRFAYIMTHTLNLIHVVMA